MKYFVDDDHWDIFGYSEQLEKLLPRFNKETRTFFKKHRSFHDAKVLSCTVVNEDNGKTKDPTTVKMVLRQHGKEGAHFEIRWLNVRKFLMDFDIKRNVYDNNSKEIVFGGRNGIDDWAYDEITPLSKKKLKHEILLFSQTTIIIHCSTIKIRKLKDVIMENDGTNGLGDKNL